GRARAAASQGRDKQGGGKPSPYYTRAAVFVYSRGWACPRFAPLVLLAPARLLLLAMRGPQGRYNHRYHA
ncbi:MAG TPA: hypothetical protein VJ761_17365, partial [Ktedonobacteraceae bacterium]|nr:hypothetical protein [Ktedonobacteraceae bacterium]